MPDWNCIELKFENGDEIRRMLDYIFAEIGPMHVHDEVTWRDGNDTCEVSIYPAPAPSWKKYG